jgi:hypothetical protein
MNNKYNNSKIYKIEPICEYDEGDIYIGSTIRKYLSERISEHRKDYKRWKNGTDKRKCMSFDIFEKYGLENCNIVLIETINASTKDEVKSKEGYYIRSMKCINKYIPDRTQKEWGAQYYQENKEDIDKRNKAYQEKNKDKIQNYQNEYRNNPENKQRKKDLESQSVQCECGCMSTKNKLKRHQQTIKHKTLMEKN